MFCSNLRNLLNLFNTERLSIGKITKDIFKVFSYHSSYLQLTNCNAVTIDAGDLHHARHFFVFLVQESH